MKSSEPIPSSEESNAQEDRVSEEDGRVDRKNEASRDDDLVGLKMAMLQDPMDSKDASNESRQSQSREDDLLALKAAMLRQHAAIAEENGDDPEIHKYVPVDSIPEIAVKDGQVVHTEFKQEGSKDDNSATGHGSNGSTPNPVEIAFFQSELRDMEQRQSENQEMNNSNAPQSDDFVAQIPEALERARTPLGDAVVSTELSAHMNPESGGLEVDAYVADTVVDASGVAIIMSEDEEREFERQRRNKFILYGVGVFLCVAFVIILTVVLYVRKNPTVVNIEPSSEPSAYPSSIPSAVPTSSNFATFVNFLLDNKLVDAETIALDSSPQRQAALWLMDEDTYWLEQGQTNLNDPIFLQRFALSVLYFSTNGDNWLNCGRSSSACNAITWLAPENECSWFAVDCSTDGAVVYLKFPEDGNSLNGTLPTVLSLLTGLNVIHMPANDLQGKIDQIFVDLTELNSIDLSDNLLSGTIPGEMLSKNSGLKTLVIGNNRITGIIPNEINDALQVFTLDSNMLTGSIPNAVSFMASLQKLNFESNRLNGTIPNGIYSLSTLETFRLRNNTALSGTIDNRIGRLSNLKELFLGDTSIGGTLPDGLYELRSIEELNLQNASFSGQLSEDFTLISRVLRELILSHNLFTGPLPEALDVLTRLESLQLEGNKLTGTISNAVCDQKGLRFAELALLTVDCNITCDCCDVDCPEQ